MPKKFIVAGEIIKIHNYLLKSPKLRYMTGGSILIETFSKDFVPCLKDCLDKKAKIYLSAAGRFMAGFDTKEKAGQFADIIRFVGNNIFGPDINLVCEANCEANNNKNIIQDVGDILEKMKICAGRRESHDMPGLQYMKRCDECREWGAEAEAVWRDTDTKDQEKVNLCHLCYLKLLARQGGKITIYFPTENFPEVLQNDIVLRGVVFYRGADGKNTNTNHNNFLQIPYAENSYNCHKDDQVQQPLSGNEYGNGRNKIDNTSHINMKSGKKKFKDFQSIASESNPPYIGIFYADGNEMGTLISECTDLDEYKTLSESISSTTENALKSAVEAVTDTTGTAAGAAKANQSFVGRILIHGGDDLLAVLPADIAVDFALEFMKKAVDDKKPLHSDGKPLENMSPLKKGICGGLVFAPCNMPFTNLYDLADSLCTNAKNKIWFFKKNTAPVNSQVPVSHEVESPGLQLTPEQQSAMDFMLVTSSLIQEPGSIKERQIYQNPENNNYTFFTARPYRLSEFQSFVEEIRKFKESDLPRRVFMDLKNIFIPAELEQSGRIDKKNHFKELTGLVKRIEKLYPQHKNKISSFFNADLLDPATWKEKNSRGSETDALRVWQADIVEIVDFI